MAHVLNVNCELWLHRIRNLVAQLIRAERHGFEPHHTYYFLSVPFNFLLHVFFLLLYLLALRTDQ